jgi:hypothetical protein
VFLLAPVSLVTARMRARFSRESLFIAKPVLALCKHSTPCNLRKQAYNACLIKQGGKHGR